MHSFASRFVRINYRYVERGEAFGGVVNVRRFVSSSAFALCGPRRREKQSALRVVGAMTKKRKTSAHSDGV